MPASARLRLATTAKLQHCALAFPAAQPQRDSSGASIRRGTAPTQTHRPRARRLPGTRRCHVAHLPDSKFEALARFTLQACCMSKQICLQSVRLSVCRHPGVKEPSGRRSPRDKDATGIGSSDRQGQHLPSPPALPQAGRRILPARGHPRLGSAGSLRLRRPADVDLESNCCQGHPWYSGRQKGRCPDAAVMAHKESGRAQPAPLSSPIIPTPIFT